MTTSPKLRLQIVVDSIEPGGAQNLLPGFAGAAAEAGIEVAVAYLRASDTVVPLAEAGVEPVLLPTASLLGRADLARVRAYLAEASPDVVHTHLGYSDLIGGRAARSLGVPAISTLHQVTWSTGAMRDRIKDRLMARARKRCAFRVIAVSEAVRERYLSFGWDTPSRVVTIHNGIADRSEPGAGPAVRSELGLSADDLVLTMVSVLRRDKAGFIPPPDILTVAGHDIAAEAMRLLREKLPNARLVVVGDGPERDAVAAEMSDLGDGVVLAGHRPDVPRILDATDVLIHPAHNDAFPTVLLEAMASRVAVVASAVGGVPEIVDDGVTGRLIEAPPAAANLLDALHPLLVDPSLRRRLGDGGRARFEREFTTARWMGRLVPVYEAAARSRPG